MQKEVIPVAKPEYKYIGKATLAEIIGKAFPKQLIPTKRMGTIFGLIFLLAILLAIFNFPLSSMASMDTNISIAVGYPYPFLDFSLTEVEDSPLKIANLIIDMILYLVLAYIIDILISLITKNSLFKSKEQAKKHPTIFKDQRPNNVAETITKKVFQEPPKKLQP